MARINDVLIMIENMNIENPFKIMISEQEDLIWETGKTDTEVIKLEKEGLLSGINSILEIGCGVGDTCKFFSELGIKTLGIDIHSDTIKKAKSKENKNLIFKCEDFLDFKINSTFDMIYDNTLYQNSVSSYSEEYLDSYLSKLHEISSAGTLFFANWMKHDVQVELLNPELPLIHIQDIINDFASWWDIKFIREGLYDFTKDYNEEMGEEYVKMGGIKSYAVLMERKL